MQELLAELFSSRVRAAVLALLLPRPHLGFSLTELSRRLDVPISSLQHECYKLTRIGLLRDERSGNARRYRPDPSFPLLNPLTSLTLCAIPLNEALRGAAEGVPGLESAWIAGSLAESTEPLYLVMVGQLDLDEVDGLFDRARLAIDRGRAVGRLELAYFLPDDWQRRLVNGDPFSLALVSGPRIEMMTMAVADA